MNFEPDNSIHQASYGYYGYFDTQPSEQQFGDMVPENGLGLMFSKGGHITVGYNVDLTQKVIQNLKAKRRQHKERYLSNIKVYYMLVDGPPTALGQVMNGRNEILRQLKEREILFISTIYMRKEKFFRSHVEFRRNDLISIDFSNRFLE